MLDHTPGRSCHLALTGSSVLALLTAPALCWLVHIMCSCITCMTCLHCTCCNLGFVVFAGRSWTAACVDPTCWSQMTVVSWVLVQQIMCQTHPVAKLHCSELHPHAMLVPTSRKLVPTNVSMAWQTANESMQNYTEHCNCFDMHAQHTWSSLSESRGVLPAGSIMVMMPNKNVSSVSLLGWNIAGTAASSLCCASWNTAQTWVWPLRLDQDHR